MTLEPMGIVWAGNDAERGEERGEIGAKDVEGNGAEYHDRGAERELSCYVR